MYKTPLDSYSRNPSFESLIITHTCRQKKFTSLCKCLHIHLCAYICFFFQEGKKADLIIIDPDTPNMLPMNDPVSNMVTAMQNKSRCFYCVCYFLLLLLLIIISPCTMLAQRTREHTFTITHMHAQAQQAHTQPTITRVPVVLAFD